MLRHRTLTALAMVGTCAAWTSHASAKPTNGGWYALQGYPAPVGAIEFTAGGDLSTAPRFAGGTPLTVAAGNCYRLLARRLPRYELATPDRIWRHFLDNTGSVNVYEDHVRVDLALRTYTPGLIDAGFPELDITIPWWGGHKLRFGFPPR